MAALTPTLVYRADKAAGGIKEKCFSFTFQSASDTIDLSGYFDTILDVVPRIVSGQDADFQTVHATFSGTTVTLDSLESDGTAADEFTSVLGRIVVTGTDYGVANP